MVSGNFGGMLTRGKAEFLNDKMFGSCSVRVEDLYKYLLISNYVFVVYTMYFHKVTKG